MMGYRDTMGHSEPITAWGVLIFQLSLGEGNNKAFLAFETTF
jgi:hypothetical protein